MPTIRRLFLIILTFIIAFFGILYGLAYMVKPKIAELTITIPRDKLNIRPWPLQPLESEQTKQALDGSAPNGNAPNGNAMQPNTPLQE